MGLLGKFTKAEGVTVMPQTDREGYQSFSTPFLKVGTGNLSLPTVWSRYLRNGFIPFGDDNLYPQLLNQMYYTSPLHGSIVDFKVQASIGGGYDIDFSKLTAVEKVRFYTISQWLNLDKMVNTVASELVIHDRVYFFVKLVKGEVKGLEFVGSEKIRTNADKSVYFYSEDYLNSTKALEYKPYSKDCKEGKYILCFENCKAGQDIYPIPRYSSALNFAFLSGELSYLAKANIQNSVFPSFAMMFPKKPQSREEMDEIQGTVNKLKGAENAGKAVGFFANGKENLPELVSVPTNQNDKLFIEASALNTEQICFAHTIDPILMGVRTSGSLGNGSDIKQSYIIFEKNVIIPLRMRIMEIFNDIFKLCGIDVKIEIRNYQIINDAIVEVEKNETVIALTALPDQIRALVLANMTPDEIRSLANLKSNLI